MLDFEDTYKKIPFILNGSEQSKSDSGDKFYYRPFAIFKQDLEVDFNNPVQPVLINLILKCCLINENKITPHDSSIWELQINKRILCLLLISENSSSHNISIETKCHNTSCNELIEAELSLQNLILLNDEVINNKIEVAYKDKKFVFRRPKGIDQIEWLKHHFQSEKEASKFIYRSLLINPKEINSFNEYFSEKFINEMNNKFDQFDPVVNFSFDMKCPVCEMQFAHQMNLEEYALKRLKRSQSELLYTIHLLAKNYKWSEKEIFSIPFWRRKYYLGIIQRENS